ncbi:anaerobic ribonucleoside-triphosphate reductase activating protein [Aureitalea sp. L0-47]|nr:anaerobic ribonucleoside-triphosphate reductase activating protein [Aureitalea sp. L0-47]
MWNKKIVCDLTPFSLIDYPDKTSCIVWFAGCNMRCRYCYNPEIVFGKGQLRLGEVLEFVKSRDGLLDGVVFSGGECTLHEEIMPFSRALKELGLLVKIDTNGSKPDLIQKMLRLSLIDYVSLDFKAPLHKFKSVTDSTLFKEFERSLQILLKAEIPFELRTTFHSELLNDSDLRGMIEFVNNAGYTGNYYIQNYIHSGNTVGRIENRHNRLQTQHLSSNNIVIRN